MNPVGLLGFAGLSFLPGAWLAYGLRLPGLGYGTRALLSVALSPPVLLLQFYVVRLLGVPFDATVWLLLIVNLPAAAIAYRRRPEGRAPTAWKVALSYALVWALPLALAALRFWHPEFNALRAHHFLHSDIVYSLADGRLRPEEAQLAGLIVGYPWGGHVPQAVLSRMWGTAPVANYIWTNLMWLFVAVALLGRVTGRLGGGAAARVLTVVWILFAMNAVGYTLSELAPEELATRYPVWGDARFTPWLRKYFLWNQHPFAHALFAGILHLSVVERATAFSRSGLVLTGSLVAGFGAMYPLMIPAAAALPVSRFAYELVRRGRGSSVQVCRDTGAPVAAIILAGLVSTAIVLALMAEDRLGGGGPVLSTLYALKTKSASALVSLSPFLVALAVLAKTRRGRLPERWGIPVLGGLASTALFVVFEIPNGANEYKFMFTAAMCLAPIAALGFEAFHSRGGPWRGFVYGLLVLFLMAAGAHKLVRESVFAMERIRTGPPLTSVSVGEFDLRLAEGEELAPAFEAIVREAPPHAIVALDSAAIHVPVFTRRALYAPPRTDEALPGVSFRLPYLLESLRSYGPEVVRGRQDVVRRLFESDDPLEGRRALETMGRLGRPVIVLLDLPRHGGLLERLRGFEDGVLLHRDEAAAVWLWPSTDGP